MDTPAQPFADPAMEADFQHVQQLIANPPRVQQKTLILLGSLAVFVAVTIWQGTTSVVDLASLVGVLLVHELGHAIAMRLLGYTDVRIFFIPFFGAAAAGKRRGVARWKQAIVLLAGPLPGIVAGGVLVWTGTGTLHQLALQLLIINGLNLLPLVPLDGGQLFQLLLFSRQRHLEVVFQGLTAAAIMLFGATHELWVLAGVGYVLLITLGHRKRVLDAAQRWRDREPPEDPAALDEVGRRALYHDAWQLLPPRWQKQWRGKPKPQLATMQQIVERAAQKAPSWAATGGVLVVWLAALAGAVACVFLAFTTAAWQPYAHEQPHFIVDMPGKVREQAVLGSHAAVATVGKRREYDVLWMDLAPRSAEAWLTATRTSLVPTGELVRDVPGPASERRFVLRKGTMTTEVRLVASRGTGFIVLATAPDEEADSHRFIDSFAP